MKFCGWCLVLLLLGWTQGASAQEPDKGDKPPAAPAKAEPIQVPYRLTNTQHVLVRVKINGKGPFNFIVDTGAPIMILSSEAGKKLGLKLDDKSVATIDKVEIEGGVVLEKFPCLVDTPFQFKGMNGMGLAGRELHGLLGYTALAKFRLEFDFTKDKMLWTPLDYVPPQPRSHGGKGGQDPSLEMLGTVMQFMGFLIGVKKQETAARGFIGIETTSDKDKVSIVSVLGKSPAAAAGLQAGDQILEINSRAVRSPEDLHRLTAEAGSGQTMQIVIRRGATKLNIRLAMGRRTMKKQLALSEKQIAISDKQIAISDKQSAISSGKLASWSPRRTGCRLLLISCCLSLFSQTLCAQEAKPIRVPFELTKTQHMVVQVKVNGKGPFTLVFDTGTPITLLSNKIGKEASVFGKDFKMPFFAPFGALEPIKIKSLEVGDVKAEGVSAMVMDHPTIRAMAQILKLPIEGIVGFPFFARFRTTIDYQAKELTFVPTKFDPPDMIANLTKMIEEGGGAAKKKFLAPGGLFGVKVAKEAADQEAGVTIQEVYAGSPAAAAGLQTGDRLLVVDGRWTDSVLDTYDAATSLRPGTEVRIVIQRQGKEETKTLKVQPGL